MLLVAFVFATIVLSATFSISAIANESFIKERLQAPCNPLSNGFCGLPYPSNYYSYEDKESPTGKRLFVPDQLFSESFYTNYGENMRPSRVIKGLSGYSALTSVLFEIPRAFDKQSLPAEGGDTIQVFNMTTGKRIPVYVSAMDFANRQDENTKQVIIQIYPRGRWPFSHHIVAVLTDKLTTNGGSKIKPSQGVQQALNQHNTNYQEVKDFIAKQNINPNNIISFTDFQVRDEASVTQTSKTFMQRVAADDHPIQITDINYPWFGSAAAEISGQVRLSDFRLEDGRVDFREDSDAKVEPKTEWADFSLVLPEQASHQSVPLIIYGHGFGGNKDRAISMAKSAGILDKGIAVIAINFPYAGTRVGEDGKKFSQFFRTQEHYTKITGAIGQANLDLYSLSLAVQRHLSTLNILPELNQDEQNKLLTSTRLENNLETETEQLSDKSQADLDLNNIYYVGTSMGSMFGSAFAALDPSIKGAFLELAGSNIGMVINTSAITEGIHDSSTRLRNWGLDEYFENTGFLPVEFSPAEAALAFNLVLHRSDYGDGLNYAHYFSNGSNGSQKALAINYGINDKVVPNYGAYSIATVAGLSLSGFDKDQLRPLADNELVSFASEQTPSTYTSKPVVKNTHAGSGLYRSENMVPDFLKGKLPGILISHISAKFSESNRLAINQWISTINSKR